MHGIIKGYALFNIGNFHEANVSIDKLLEINPENVHVFSALFIKASGLFMLEEYQKQLELSNELIEISENSLEKLYALNIKSNALLKLDQYDESEIIIDNILNGDSESESALANKATIFSEQGNYHEAIVYYESSLEIYNKKISDYNSNKTKGKVLLPGKMLNNIVSEIYVNKGKAHQKLQETTKALECYNIPLKLDPEYKEAQKAIKLQDVNSYE
jgi:tetratricopeptide (TPR) repeat protein